MALESFEQLSGGVKLVGMDVCGKQAAGLGVERKAMGVRPEELISK